MPRLRYGCGDMRVSEDQTPLLLRHETRDQRYDWCEVREKKQNILRTNISLEHYKLRPQKANVHEKVHDSRWEDEKLGKVLKTSL